MELDKKNVEKLKKDIECITDMERLLVLWTL